MGKTKSALITDLEKEVKEIHPDEVPCIISWEIDAGHELFMKWLSNETR